MPTQPVQEEAQTTDLTGHSAPPAQISRGRALSLMLLSAAVGLLCSDGCQSRGTAAQNDVPAHTRIDDLGSSPTVLAVAEKRI